MLFRIRANRQYSFYSDRTRNRLPCTASSLRTRAPALGLVHIPASVTPSSRLRSIVRRPCHTTTALGSGLPNRNELGITLLCHLRFHRRPIPRARRRGLIRHRRAPSISASRQLASAGRSPRTSLRFGSNLRVCRGLFGRHGGCGFCASGRLAIRKKLN